MKGQQVLRRVRDENNTVGQEVSNDCSGWLIATHYLLFPHPDPLQERGRIAV